MEREGRQKFGKEETLSSGYAVGQGVLLKRAYSIPLGNGTLRLAMGMFGLVRLSVGETYWVEFEITESVKLELKVAEVDLKDAGEGEK